MKTTKRATGALAIAVAGLCALACSSTPPVLAAVMPATGYPRQLLAVDGDTIGASVVWDAGSGTETVMTNGLFGTQYFQVPDGAAPGPHQVALRNQYGTSPTTTVTVLPPAPTFPAPRIEDIGMLGVSGPGPMDVVLTIAAANMDVNATVAVDEEVDGRTEARSVGSVLFWSGLPIDYQQARQPDTFGYPVYHYAQQIVVVKGVSFNGRLHIRVRNNDGLDNATVFTLPASEGELDSDGDGLLDAWEQNGYTAMSGNKISLSAMGTNVWRKDVLVEVDHTLQVPIHADLWTDVEAVFRNAPVLNPDGSAGINVIIDRGQGGAFTQGGQELPDHDCLTLENPAPAPSATLGCSSMTSFYDYKKNYFDPDRLELFHYAVWGNRMDSWDTGIGERWGNDFFVALARFYDPSSLVAQLGTFVHELGHNLSLTHGGLFDNTEPFELKPNLLSVMSYVYQPVGVDVDCDGSPDRVVTYSQGILKLLSEPLVDENIGICDKKPIDFDFNMTFVAAAADLNLDGDTADDWHDFDQWGQLKMNFRYPGSRWRNN